MEGFGLPGWGAYIWRGLHGGAYFRNFTVYSTFSNRPIITLSCVNLFQVCNGLSPFKNQACVLWM